jgi:DNA-binding CsgD family transcriptional regulator
MTRRSGDTSKSQLDSPVEKKDPPIPNGEIVSATSSRRDSMSASEMLRTKVESSLETRIVGLIDQDYAMITGDKIRQMFAGDVVALVKEEYRELDSLEVGQVLWMGVHKDDRPSYGKNARNTQLVPVSLSLISRQDIEMMMEGYSNREIRERRIVRLFNEAYQQDALLSNADVSVLIGVSPTTVSKHSREFMEREGVVIPTRGTVHDLGMATTHKKVIIRLFLDGHLTPAIARITNHSEEAVDRYIRAFEKVNLLKDKDVDYIHKATGMSRWLIESYLAIIEEYSIDGDET